MKVTTQEQGWAGHFICSNMCNFRRNTLVSQGRKKIIVSTVGNYNPEYSKGIQEIGYNRYYETMVFKAKKIDGYWEADVTKEVSFDSNWCINEALQTSDMKANKMHDAVVKEFVKKWESIA